MSSEDYSSIRFVDQDLKPLRRKEWVDRFLKPRYRNIVVTKVHDRWSIKTRWYGFNISEEGLLALYFGTEVIDLEDPAHEVLVRRYPTIDAARRGHREVVKGYREGKYPPKR